MMWRYLSPMPEFLPSGAANTANLGTPGSHLGNISSRCTSQRCASQAQRYPSGLQLI